MKSVAAAFMTARHASRLDGMPMSLYSSTVRFTLSGNTIDALPRCTGIYRFLGEQDQLLYIGKSVNIYSRVRSHFARSGQGDRQRRMIHATRTVDCRPTAGEAGALLLENAAIKQEMPLFNRRQRRLRNMWSIVIEQGKHGFLEPRVRSFSLEDPDVRAAYGLFSNRRAAQKTLLELARVEGLCSIRLALESGRGPCFQFQLGRCRGACADRESFEEHNTRLLEALKVHRLSAWPITKPVLLHEYAAQDGVQPFQEWHLLHNWAYMGTYQDPKEALAGDASAQCMFDRDTYQILRRVLRKSDAQLYCATTLMPLDWPAKKTGFRSDVGEFSGG
jgi:excinuclease Cho